MSVWTSFKFNRTRLDPCFVVAAREKEEKEKELEKQREIEKAKENESNHGETKARIGGSQLTQQLRDHMAANDELNENDNELEDDDIDITSNDSKLKSENNNNNNNNIATKKRKPKKTLENQSKLSADFIRHGKKEIFCPTCRNGGDPLEDSKAARIVCRSCGLVLEVGYISEQSEWRNFADGDSSGPDPNRVGSAGHYLLADQHDLSTTVDDGHLRNLQQSTASSKTTTKLSSAIHHFEVIGRELGINKDTQNCAGEIFKDLQDCEDFTMGHQKTRSAIAMYMACRMCNNQRPFKEVCSAFRADAKQVRKLHSEIQKLEAAKKLHLAKHRKLLQNRNQVRINREASESRAEVYAIRYASKLQCEKRMNKYLKEIVRAAEKLTTRQPTSLAAACVFLACAVQDDPKNKRSYKEVSAETGVGVTTIQNVYRGDLYRHRMKLVPRDFCDPLKLKNMKPE